MYICSALYSIGTKVYVYISKCKKNDTDITMCFNFRSFFWGCAPSPFQSLPHFRGWVGWASVSHRYSFKHISSNARFSIAMCFNFRSFFWGCAPSPFQSLPSLAYQGWVRRSFWSAGALSAKEGFCLEVFFSWISSSKLMAASSIFGSTR